MKGVLFDFWGTIVENGVFPSPVRQAWRMMRTGLPFQEFIVRFEKAFMTKPFPDLKEAFTAACEEFEVVPSEELINNLVGMWNKNELLCKPFPEAVPLLEELKQGYKLGLISNTPPSIERVIEKFELAKYFDAIILSYKEGLLKTDPALFEKALKKLGLGKEDVLMIGDSLETDVKGAEQAGIKAVLLDRRDRRDYPEKVRSLEEVKKYL